MRLITTMDLNLNNPDQALHLAQKYSSEGNPSAAVDLLNQLLEKHPNDGSIYHVLGMILGRHNSFDQAVNYLRKSIMLAPAYGAFYSNFGNILQENNKLSAAREMYEKAIELDPDLYPPYENLSINYSLQNKTEKALQILDNFSLRKYGNPSERPSMTPSAPVFFALPKSAGTFISTCLGKTLGVSVQPEQAASAVGLFPSATLAPIAFNNLVRQPHVIHQHISFSQKNLSVLLYSGVNKLIIHVRDPRQSLLSYYHHCQSPYSLGSARNCILDENYASLNNSNKLQWLLEQYYPMEIAWIMSWLDFEANLNRQKFQILITSYDEMLSEGEKKFIERLCTFEGYGDKEVKIVEKSPGVRFRKGAPEDWRQFFGPSQKKIMWDMVPQLLREKFRWKP